MWRRIYRDHWHGEAHPHAFHRDDGNVDIAESAAHYFVAPRGDVDRAALETLTGRILDLGCGPGSYTLFLESRGCTVVAVDSSAGAIEVCRARGCRDARVVGIDEVDGSLGVFDALICMGNTFGIGSSPEHLPGRLARMGRVLSPGGGLLAALIDPLATDAPHHLRYHERNRAVGRPPGLTRARLEYRGELGDWWNLWMPTESELLASLSRAAWKVGGVTPAGSSRL